MKPGQLTNQRTSFFGLGGQTIKGAYFAGYSGRHSPRAFLLSDDVEADWNLEKKLKMRFIVEGEEW